MWITAFGVVAILALCLSGVAVLLEFRKASRRENVPH
jgi:hypothetical protein